MLALDCAVMRKMPARLHSLAVWPMCTYEFVLRHQTSTWFGIPIVSKFECYAWLMGPLSPMHLTYSPRARQWAPSHAAAPGSGGAAVPGHGRLLRAIQPAVFRRRPCRRRGAGSAASSGAPAAPAALRNGCSRKAPSEFIQRSLCSICVVKDVERPSKLHEFLGARRPHHQLRRGWLQQ